MAGASRLPHSIVQAMELVGVPQSTAQSTAPRLSQEELDRRLSMLADQSFDPKQYLDPLAPRQGVEPHFYPNGVTLAMERQWLAKIEAAKKQDPGRS